MTYRPLVTEAQSVDTLLALPFLPEVDKAHAPYRVAKAALNRATQLLAADPEFAGVPVVAVCPGWVQTDMGGANAHRTPSQGAGSILAQLLPEEIPTGTFTRDGKPVDWW